ncbi:MAG: DUF480 domain-containing protein [Phycisphaerae bacterium]|nr:DUF480 domain-containing protein [Phycisphaerae bacterium]
MLRLAPHECRVLGVLVEKALTVPAQYPLTLNSLVLGSNQRNNRDPVTDLDEERVLAALDSLRAKGLVHEVSLSGSRVPKYRHLAREVLSVSTAELVLLAELLLRGPQTAGELRSRAGRMHPLESMEVVGNLLESLRTREAPLVEELAPIPGTRAARFRQLLCPDLHPIDAAPPSPTRTATGDEGDLSRRVAELKRRLEAVEGEVRQLRGQT